MDSHSKKFVTIFLLLLAVAKPATTLSASKQQMVWRRWVVKLKQNSWMNKRPFQFATPVTDGEMVFVGVHRGIFYAVKAKRGRKLWHFKTEGPVYAKATWNSDRVFVADGKGTVYALKKLNGDVGWKTHVGGEVMSAPLVFENKLYVVTMNKELAALDLQTGAVLWKRQQGARDSGFTVRGSADPVLVQGNLLVGYSDGTLVAHDPQTGNVRWVKELGDRIQEFHDVDATVLLAGELAYVTSADGKLFALNPKDGSTVWQASAGSVNDAVLADSFLYVAAEGVVTCFQADSGQILWEQDLQVPEISSPVIYGSWLAVAAATGKLYFLDRKTGDVYHSWFVKGGSYGDPVMDGSRLYLLSNSARLYQFEFK